MREDRTMDPVTPAMDRTLREIASRGGSITHGDHRRERNGALRYNVLNGLWNRALIEYVRGDLRDDDVMFRITPRGRLHLDGGSP